MYPCFAIEYVAPRHPFFKIIFIIPIYFFINALPAHVATFYMLNNYVFTIIAFTLNILFVRILFIKIRTDVY